MEALLRALLPGDTTAARALLAGARSDRLGYAFATGYQQALCALVKSDVVSALCVTEARGNSPKDIDTTLTPVGDGFDLTGSKKWATAATRASTLLVCAKTGTDGQGRNMLVLVRVPTTAPGVTLTPSNAPFIPEISHAEVSLERVRVAASDILPGDGYTDYVKPFRTVEDLHVHAALVGYLIGVAHRHDLGRELVEQWLAVVPAVHGLAIADPKSPAVHLALAGLITRVAQLVDTVEAAWAARGGDEEHSRWQRDRPLLKVASVARAARRDAAWAALQS